MSDELPRPQTPTEGWEEFAKAATLDEGYPDVREFVMKAWYNGAIASFLFMEGDPGPDGKRVPPSPEQLGRWRADLSRFLDWVTQDDPPTDIYAGISDKPKRPVDVRRVFNARYGKRGT